MNDMTQPDRERGLADILAELGEETPEMPVDTEPAAVRPQGEQREPTAADDVLELDGAFDYEGYQVVRREFFAHTAEPSVTFNNYKFYVNAACLRRFPNVDFVQILVNQERKILAIRPCSEQERDSFAWATPGKGHKKTRQITCRLFFAKVFP